MLNARFPERIRAAGASAFFITLLYSSLTGNAWPVTGFIAMVAALANLEFGIFMARRQGLLFGIAATLYHQLYYTYSVMVFTWCQLEHRLDAILGRLGLSRAEPGSIDS